MKSVFEQPWLYALIAFVLGVVVGYLARGRRAPKAETGPRHAMSTQSEKDSASRPVATLLSPAAARAAAAASEKPEPTEPEPTEPEPAADVPAAAEPVALADEQDAASAPQAGAEPVEPAEPQDPALSQLDHENLTSALREAPQPTEPAAAPPASANGAESAEVDESEAIAQTNGATAAKGSAAAEPAVAPGASADGDNGAETAEPATVVEPNAATDGDDGPKSVGATKSATADDPATAAKGIAAEGDVAPADADTAAGKAAPATESAAGAEAATESTVAAVGAAPADVAWAPGPYPASALPGADGEAPADEFTIKAKADSKLFHTEKSPYYRRVKPDVWFRTEADAVAAGFTGWARRAKAK